MNTWAMLLSPVAVDHFFSEHWNRTPLYIAGTQSKFGIFPGLKDLPSLLNGSLSEHGWAKGHVHNAQGSFVDREGNVKMLNALPPMWPDLFNAGVSLCFSSLDGYHDGLAQFVKGIGGTTALSGKVYTTGYLTPPHSGSVMHFDSQHVFFMQVSGTKHWRFSAKVAWEDAPTNILLPMLETPRIKTSLEMIGVKVACPNEIGVQEVTLNTGDVLYLPPGFWHEGHTSDTHSLHYSLTLPPLGSWQLLITYLRRLYFAKPSLRRDLRYAADSGDRSVARALEAAITELRDALCQLSPDDVEKWFVQVTSTESMLNSHLTLP